MQLSSNPFEWLGEALGTLVRIVVDSLAWVFNVLSGASTAFVNGFSRALGVDSNVFTVVAVIIGLLLIYAGVRSLLRRRFVAAVVWLLLGLWLLSALIN
ncbi:hypothetical protein [Halopseudomonas sp.]|jgi:hypothetical protein|uniref:hypothetical protein n=1 Tax=Halopseudomonas sp. TaxID=2901191 RepID=UPI001A576C5D|nr:hypothetical protein [Pseudomonas sp.]|tara:strand:+ start:1503 stop:1799 length:297 start_codon:yes stop_codon:yes gene_type:complete